MPPWSTGPAIWNGKVPLPTTSEAAKDPVNDTTCVNVVDRSGNAFSATPSGAWLPSVIAGDTGIPLTTRLQSFVMTPGHPNHAAAGKRPRVTLSPTMVTKAGQFVLEMSTPGGDNQDQALLQVLLNIIDFGMTAQEAVEAPRFQTEHFYSSFGNHEFVPGQVEPGRPHPEGDGRRADRAGPPGDYRGPVEQLLGSDGDPAAQRRAGWRSGHPPRAFRLRPLARSGWRFPGNISSAT